jgi:hypothetical protein
LCGRLDHLVADAATWSPLESSSCEPWRTFAELINTLGGIGFRERLVEFFACLSAQCLEVRALGVGHRFVAGLPVIGIALEGRLVYVPWVIHAANSRKTHANSTIRRLGQEGLSGRFIIAMLLLRIESLPSGQQ